MSRIRTLTLKSQKDISYLTARGRMYHCPVIGNHHGRKAFIQCFYDIRSPSDALAINRVKMITRGGVIMLRSLIKTLGGKNE